MYNINVLIGVVLVAAAGYFLGSLNAGIIISKLIYHDDIRKYGSGNAGMTNMLRTYGKPAAAATFIGDGLKTVIAVLIGALILGTHNVDFLIYEGETYSTAAEFALKLRDLFGEETATVMLENVNAIPNLTFCTGIAGMYIGGLASILGHAFPVYYNFKGGKSVTAAFFMVLCTNPLIALICLALFVIIVAWTKYISLGSIMAIIMYPLILNRIDGAGIHNLIAIVVMLLIIYWHRNNIKRIWDGTELKLNLGRKSAETEKESKKEK
jgi:glycerol-3-phosphate acyltransferase PlsY